MKIRIALMLFLSFFVFIFLGCAGLTGTSDNSLSKTSGLLEPSTIVKFNDVPVPAGFQILPQSSYCFESAGLRVGVLKYRGKANPDQVVTFYKDQMPMYNWSLLNIVEYGDRLLNFDRENETCIVSLLPKGNLVTITVSIGPKAQAPAKKAVKPVK